MITIVDNIWRLNMYSRILLLFHFLIMVLALISLKFALKWGVTLRRDTKFNKQGFAVGSQYQSANFTTNEPINIENTLKMKQAMTFIGKNFTFLEVFFTNLSINKMVRLILLQLWLLICSAKVVGDLEEISGGLNLKLIATNVGSFCWNGAVLFSIDLLMKLNTIKQLFSKSSHLHKISLLELQMICISLCSIGLFAAYLIVLDNLSRWEVINISIIIGISFLAQEILAIVTLTSIITAYGKLYSNAHVLMNCWQTAANKTRRSLRVQPIFGERFGSEASINPDETECQKDQTHEKFNKITKLQIGIPSVVYNQYMARFTQDQSYQTVQAAAPVTNSVTATNFKTRSQRLASRKYSFNQTAFLAEVKQHYQSTVGNINQQEQTHDADPSLQVQAFQSVLRNVDNQVCLTDAQNRRRAKQKHNLLILGQQADENAIEQEQKGRWVIKDLGIAKTTTNSSLQMLERGRKSTHCASLSINCSLKQYRRPTKIKQNVYMKKRGASDPVLAEQQKPPPFFCLEELQYNQ